MSELFGSAYARAYDVLYQEKDYDGECDLLERVFRSHAAEPIRSILDLGCGTGNHALRLAARGYQVVGVDRSLDMLRAAQSKAREQGLSVTLHHADIREADLNRAFDAALLMFAVLGYQLDNQDVLAALRVTRRHLRPNGLLVLDVWYGPAVLAQRPVDRIRVIRAGSDRTLRSSSGQLDVRRHLCTVHFHVWQMNERQLVAETEESHSIRFFFPRELELFLELAGFHLRRLGAFPDFDREPNETTWNVMAVAEAA